MTQESCNRLNAIYRFVRSHGFRAEVTDVVTVWIPYTWEVNGVRGTGEDKVTLTTMTGARHALGY